MCPACQSEYENENDRRFHAQTVCCPECGPVLSYIDSQGNELAATEEALEQAAKLVESGGILALKGIGGYHLVCDARNEIAIDTLRQRKHRAAKPLAVMMQQSELNRHCELNRFGADWLYTTARPIVVLPQLPESNLAHNINPGLNQIGVMLPYAPVHYLLLQRLGFPLVMTSANQSGGCIVHEQSTLQSSLGDVYDACLDHNRRITRAVDDSVYKASHRIPVPIRLARGLAPRVFPLNNKNRYEVLAVGAQSKNTVALMKQDQIILSPHVGDLGHPESLFRFKQTINNLLQDYQSSPDNYVRDLHPDYESTRWSLSQKKPEFKVPHHIAHASAVWYEQAVKTDCIVFCWDGIGLGKDGELLGGEAYVGRPGQWRRLGSVRPVKLVGVDKAARQPWRSLTSILLQAGIRHPYLDTVDLLYKNAWHKDVQTHQVRSIGRLFDAACALILNQTDTSYEGQAGMLLESLCKPHEDFVRLPIKQGNGLYEIDWQPLFGTLIDEKPDPGDAAQLFHNSLAHALIEQAKLLRTQYSVSRVCVAGGVFQNGVLLDTVARLLRLNGFQLQESYEIPFNDAAIALGQLVEFRAVREQVYPLKNTSTTETHVQA
jgi:hydrogenase maturation protein HypF